MTERDELEEEDLEGRCGDIPFVVGEDIRSSYGMRYRITLDDDAFPCVVSLDMEEAASASLFTPRMSGGCS